MNDTFKALKFIDQQMEEWPLKRIQVLKDLVEERMLLATFNNMPEKLFVMRLTILDVVINYLS